MTIDQLIGIAVFTVHADGTTTVLGGDEHVDLFPTRSGLADFSLRRDEGERFAPDGYDELW